MPSLLEALERKYGFGDDLNMEEPVVSIYVPKLPPLLCVPELLVLNNCDIDCAGDSDGLKEKCQKVKELDLAQNNLSDWNEVFHILQHTPRIEFLNLSKNRFYGPILHTAGLTITGLKSVILNSTCLDWHSIEMLLKCLPVLEELHLSLNDYQKVLIDTIEANEELMAEQKVLEKNDAKLTTFTTTDNTMIYENTYSHKKIAAHKGVKKLHFTGNPVEDWHEICRLGRVFPNLETLVLADCPLRSIEPVSGASKIIADGVNNDDTPHIHFTNLVCLNLSSTNINRWDDIDRLAKFPSLKNLRVQNWPLWETCESTEHERRQLLVARLPFLQTLNGGGAISADEREDAERAFIRYYTERPNSEKPLRYNELIAIHGALNPLINIDLKPERKVNIIFTFNTYRELRLVDVYRTIVELKFRLEKIVGLAAKNMRLFYIDQDMKGLQGPEEMKFPNKQLYSYNIKSGDEILIVEKNV